MGRVAMSNDRERRYVAAALVGILCATLEWRLGIGEPWLFYVGMVLVVPLLWRAQGHRAHMVASAHRAAIVKECAKACYDLAYATERLRAAGLGSLAQREAYIHAGDVVSALAQTGGKE